MEQFGKLLVMFGVGIALAGLFLMWGRRMPLDFTYHRDNFTFYFPLGTSILISLILTLTFALINRK